MAQNVWLDAYEKAVARKQQSDLEQARMAIESRRTDIEEQQAKSLDEYRKAALAGSAEDRQRQEQELQSRNAMQALGILGSGVFHPGGAPSPGAPMSVEPNMSTPTGPAVGTPSGQVIPKGSPGAGGGAGPIDVSKIPGFGALGVSSLQLVSPEERATTEATAQAQSNKILADQKRSQILGWGADLVKQYPKINETNPDFLMGLGMMASGIPKEVAFPKADTLDSVKAQIESEAFDALKKGDITGYKQHLQVWKDFDQRAAGGTGGVGAARFMNQKDIANRASSIFARVAASNPGADANTLRELAVNEAMKDTSLGAHQAEVIQEIRRAAGSVKPKNEIDKLIEDYQKSHPQTATPGGPTQLR